MNIKSNFFILLFISLLFSPIHIKAQNTPPSNAKVISVTTTQNAEIRISLYATESDTPVWIETSSGNYIKKFVGGSNFDTTTYTVSGTILKVFGDISYFDCSENNDKITAINVTKNSSLKMLACNNNSISDLDVTKNTNLILLTCNDNNISNLDISQNKALKDLMCYNNNISNLDLSQNTALTQLWCTNNNISSLDVSQNKALTELWCGNNNIKSLDISENIHIYRLYTKNNDLVSLNVANGNNKNFKGYSNGKAFDATGNPNLKCIQIDEDFTPSATGNNNWLKDDTANWSTDCNYAQDIPPANAKVISITTTTDATIELHLRASADNTPVWIETTQGNFIKKIINNNSWDTSNYTVIGTSIKIYGDVADFTAANQEEKITALDVSKNKDLRELYCYNNNISALDVSQNTALTILFCYNNNLSTLDVSQNTALTRLYCFDNNISTLDVSQNLALTRLDCSQNNLNDLDINQNTDLIRLYCYNNNLKTLDISNNIALTYLYCFNNNISTLDVSQNLALKRLDCSHNNLNSIDISQNTSLQRLHCQNNNLIKLNVANGNNTNFKGFGLGKAFDATGNSNLSCIQIDEGFTPPNTGDNKWLKDDTANWSTNCNTSTNDINENKNVVKIYPNPIKDWVNLKSDKQIYKIQIFDSIGTFIKEFNNPSNRISIQDLITGTYIFKLFYDNKVSHIKVIKK